MASGGVERSRDAEWRHKTWRLDRNHRCIEGIEHSFGRVADEQPAQPGTRQRAHDNDARPDLVHNLRDHIGGATLAEVQSRRQTSRVDAIEHRCKRRCSVDALDVDERIDVPGRDSHLAVAQEVLTLESPRVDDMDHTALNPGERRTEFDQRAIELAETAIVLKWTNGYNDVRSTPRRWIIDPDRHRTLAQQMERGGRTSEANRCAARLFWRADQEIVIELDDTLDDRRKPHTNVDSNARVDGHHTRGLLLQMLATRIDEQLLEVDREVTVDQLAAPCVQARHHVEQREPGSVPLGELSGSGDDLWCLPQPGQGQASALAEAR